MTDPDSTSEFPPSGASANVADILARNAAYVSGFHDRDLQVRPTRQLAVVACMDSRIDAFAVLGLDNGEAHIIRNAGGVVTDDVIRSLCLSQRFLGTTEIVLVHHHDCGLQKVDEAEFRAELEAELGVKPWWSLETFQDPFADVRQSIERLRMSPFLLHRERITGFVYDVHDGRLHLVTPAAQSAGETSAARG
ncbi:MAG: carbonic anhydrase [Acidimicrobiia bacterium]|nr:carbonic anhydrase [Acidimicrobiia bacterium]